MQMTVMVVLLFTVGLFVNHSLILNLLITLCLLIVAVLMNRRGNVLIAGILAVAGLDLSIMLDLYSYPARAC